MTKFIHTLEKDVEKKLKKIEGSDLNIMKKSLEASLVLGDAFQRLREFIDTHIFKSETEEIEFFKVIKPRLYHRLIYYRKVYNIEMNRPVGVDSQRAYLIDEIKAINRYNNKHSDFVRYYRSGMTHLDSLYYLRNRTEFQQVPQNEKGAGKYFIGQEAIKSAENLPRYQILVTLQKIGES